MAKVGDIQGVEGRRQRLGVALGGVLAARQLPNDFGAKLADRGQRTRPAGSLCGREEGGDGVGHFKGVEVDDQLRIADDLKQHRGNLLAMAAPRVAGESAVEVAPIGGGGAPPQGQSQGIAGGQDLQRTLLQGGQALEQAGDHKEAGVFIAVDPGEQAHPRSSLPKAKARQGQRQGAQVTQDDGAWRKVGGIGRS